MAALAACGFQPLYGRIADSERGLKHLAAIEVLPLPERLGQILYNELRDRLTPRGVPRSPAYKLSLAVSLSRVGLSVERDESATRINLTVRVHYVLTNTETGKTLTDGTARTVAAFNVVQSEFANIAAEKDAEARAARDISNEIRTRLGVYFSQVANPGPR
jgi:LPS-assembly lipoprotein